MLRRDCMHACCHTSNSTISVHVCQTLPGLYAVRLVANGRQPFPLAYPWVIVLHCWLSVGKSICPVFPAPVFFELVVLLCRWSSVQSLARMQCRERDKRKVHLARMWLTWQGRGVLAHGQVYLTRASSA